MCLCMYIACGDEMKNEMRRRGTHKQRIMTSKSLASIHLNFLHVKMGYKYHVCVRRCTLYNTHHACGERWSNSLLFDSWLLVGNAEYKYVFRYASEIHVYTIIHAHRAQLTTSGGLEFIRVRKITTEGHGLLAEALESITFETQRIEKQKMRKKNEPRT